ncbi:MAG: response regulator [Pseudanabaenaceae cyanobacterium bins.68]|nr:response regulator [Pseudanabaenaceae cyanobacterium bins.68]
MGEKTVLVIDDSIMIRKMVKSILAGKFDVIEASDGKSGLELARNTSPDLILLDFVMPKYNGYQTLQALRRFDNLKDTPVIMISGLREQVTDHVPEPFVGFDFLEKPFDADTLIGRINNLLHISAVVAEPVAVSPASNHNIDYGATTEPSMQILLDKFNATEHLLIQGIEGVIQREVAVRVANLTGMVAEQQKKIAALEQQLHKVTHNMENQNKYLVFLVQGVKSIQAHLTKS